MKSKRVPCLTAGRDASPGVPPDAGRARAEPGAVRGVAPLGVVGVRDARQTGPRERQEVALAGERERQARALAAEPDGRLAWAREPAGEA
ncbi:MAG TPA: hypothetical protein VJ779_09215, partial [Acetobacteraceae bacterium]|nr:hypothetical protein [Acetobacteraceae bacterium]